MKSWTWRDWGKWAAIAAAAAAIVVAAPDEPQPQVQAPQAAPQAAQRAGEKRLEAPRLELAQRGDADDIGNAFQATSWYVPPPPPPPAPAAAPPPPPPQPTAPPLPFTWLGTYEDKPLRVAILVKGERMYTVAEGEVIESTYRVERVAEGFVELTYLPLDMKQTLMTRGAS